MKRKFLLLFLTLSISNLYATSETASLSENTPLLSLAVHFDIPEVAGSFSRIWLSETQRQTITRFVTVETLRRSVPSYQRTLEDMLGGEELIPLRPEYLTLRHLEGLNKADWEKWIKTYGTTESLNYLKAVDSAAEYAKTHKTAWDNLRKQMIEEPCWIYRKFHSDTMKNRRDFFNEVSRRVEFVELRSQNKTLRTEIAALRIENKNLDQTLRNEIEKLKKQVVEFKTENETLKGKLEEATASEGTIIERLEAAESQQTSVQKSVTSQIEELRTQFEELKASITSLDPELADKIQDLSEKVDAMDLEGIRADVETLKTTKVGVNFINRFSYLVQSLIIAKKRESEESRYISIEEWNQIVQEQKAKVEANSK